MQARTAPASRIIHGGDILTLDPARPTVEALAIGGGRIVGLGNRAELEPLRGATTEATDLLGRTLIPSFKDHHVHLLNAGMSVFNRAEDERLFLDLAGAASAEEIADRVAERAGSMPPGGWILGKGWNQHDWGSNSLPTYHLLSQAAPSHPVLLGRVDAHCVWVNERAMELASITTDSRDPHGGSILHTDSGELSGILLERGAEPLLATIPEYAGWEITEAFRVGAERLAAQGVTDIYDAGFLATTAIVSMGANFKLYLELLRALDADRSLPLRVNLMIPAPSPLADKVTADPEAFLSLSSCLRVTHIKLYADGAFGSRGAALSHPYADDPGTRGVVRMSAEELQCETRRAIEAGLDVATHAIGDRAVRRVLDAYEAVLDAHPGTRPSRFRIEHFGYASEDDMQRAARLGFILVAQPNFIYPDERGVTMEELRLGTENCGRVYPWKTLADLGAALAGSSDYFTSPGPPLWDFYAACTRKSPEGYPADGWHPGECLTREESLRLVTTFYPSGGMGTTGGILREGGPADLAILSANPLTADERDILSIDVDATLIEGRVSSTDGSLEGLSRRPRGRS
ncbi:MAG: amidohydrolase [Acidobacteriota bacterium]